MKKLCLALAAGAGAVASQQVDALASWDETKTLYPQAATTFGMTPSTVTTTYTFNNMSGTDSANATWEMLDYEANHITLLADVAAGGSASVTDCLEWHDGTGYHGSCDSPVSSTTTGVQTISFTLGGTSLWHADDPTGIYWPSISVTLVSGTADKSSTTAYGLSLDGS